MHRGLLVALLVTSGCARTIALVPPSPIVPPPSALERFDPQYPQGNITAFKRLQRLALLPSGKGFVYAAQTEREEYGAAAPGTRSVVHYSNVAIVENTTRLSPQNYYSVDDFAFGPADDVATAAYVLVNEKPQNFVVSKHGTWGHGSFVTLAVAFSPAGKVHYVLRRGDPFQSKPRVEAIYAEGAPVTEGYDWIIRTLAFDAAGHVLFSANVDGRWSAYRGGRKVSGSFDAITAPVARPSDGAVCYGAKAAGSWGLYCDTQLLASGFDEVRQPSATAGGRVFFVARKGGSWSVYEDGHAITAAFDDIVEPPVVSADGRHVAFAVKDGSAERVYRDGVPYSDELLHTRRLAFVPGSAEILYDGGSGSLSGNVVENTRAFVMLGRERITPAFSDTIRFVLADPSTLVFVGHDGGSQPIFKGAVKLPGAAR